MQFRKNIRRHYTKLQRDTSREKNIQNKLKVGNFKQKLFSICGPYKIHNYKNIYKSYESLGRFGPLSAPIRAQKQKLYTKIENFKRKTQKEKKN